MRKLLPVASLLLSCAACTDASGDGGLLWSSDAGVTFRLKRVQPSRLPVEGGRVSIEFSGVVPDGGVYLGIDDIPFAPLPVPIVPGPVLMDLPAHNAGLVDLQVFFIDPYGLLGELHDAVTYEYVNPAALTVAFGQHDAVYGERFEDAVRAELTGPCVRHEWADLRNVGGTPAHGLSVTVDAPFRLRTNTCPAELGWGSGCSVEVCFDGSAVGTTVGTLHVAAQGLAKDTSLSVTVLPPVDGTDARFAVRRTPPPRFRLQPWDDGAILMSDDPIAVTAAGEGLPLGADVVDAISDRDGGLLLLRWSGEVVALDTHAQPWPRFNGSSTLPLEFSMNERLFLLRDGRLVTLSVLSLHAFEPDAGRFDPSWGAATSYQFFTDFPDSATQANDDRLFFSRWDGSTASRELVEIDSTQGRLTRTLLLPPGGVFTPTPDGGLLISRAAQVLHVDGSGETPIALGVTFSPGVRALAIDGHGRLLAADDTLVRRFLPDGTLDRTWAGLGFVNQLTCPQRGGCYVVSDAIWRLTDD